MASIFSSIVTALVAATTAVTSQASTRAPLSAVSESDHDDGGLTAGTASPDMRMRVLLGPPAGRLGPQRGDYAAPDLLLMVYEDAWLDAIEAMSRAAVPSTRVHVLVDPGDAHDRAMIEWSRALGVRLMGMDFDTPWIRDYGPLQRMSAPGRVVWLDFDYGPERRLDDEVPLNLVARFDVRVEQSVFSLDGGAIVSNGAGLCAITDRSLDEAGVDANDDDAVEALLEALGCEVMAAMPDLPDEPTGHADMMVQFVARDRAIAVELDPADHPDEAFLVDMAVKTLAAAAVAAGQPLKITRIPAAYDDRDGTLYSYVNGTRLRDRYLAPSFSAVDPQLARRAEVGLRDAMPGVEIIPIPADEVLASAGVLHCITLGLSLPRAHR